MDDAKINPSGKAMRTAIVGNSGSGKSTLAKALAVQFSAPTLDLDTIYWEPGQTAVGRPVSSRVSDLRNFCRQNDSWVIEGCYGDLIEASFPRRPELLFLNPGREACLKHCLSRPFETHKYRSKEEQNRMLEPLLQWVREYYECDGPMSLAGHLELFERYDGPKKLITTPAHP